MKKSCPIRIDEARDRFIFPDIAIKLNPRLKDNVNANKLINSIRLDFLKNISKVILPRGLMRKKLEK